MATDAAAESERRCIRCGKSVDNLAYEFWLFHVCLSCIAEGTPNRWGTCGTYERKWRYFPRWHMTKDSTRDAAKDGGREG